MASRAAGLFLLASIGLTGLADGQAITGPMNPSPTIARHNPNDPTQDDHFLDRAPPVLRGMKPHTEELRGPVVIPVEHDNAHFDLDSVHVRQGVALNRTAGSSLDRPGWTQESAEYAAQTATDIIGKIIGPGAKTPCNGDRYCNKGMHGATNVQGLFRPKRQPWQMRR